MFWFCGLIFVILVLSSNGIFLVGYVEIVVEVFG